MTNIPKTLEIDASISADGIDIQVNGDHFPIRYPQKIWADYPMAAKQIYLDNLTHSATLFLPQMLNLQSILYKTSRPIGESFFFKNGIYDMPICAIEDDCSSMEYIKRFFNTHYQFADNVIKTPATVKLQGESGKKKTAVIPFSFGKESMLSFALCKELGIEPILINFIESVNDFEHMHKIKLIEAFEKEFQLEIHTIEYGPSMLRDGRHWKLGTELGWGLHTTEYALLCLPFVSYFEADYIILGNEQSCDTSFYDGEGVLTYECGYDQHNEWTSQQGLLSSLLLGRKVEVVSFVEPVHEMAIVYMLHHRYPDYAKYQMSCMANNENAAKNRWCQSCSKCALNYTFCRAMDVDPGIMGISEDLFEKDTLTLFSNFFGYYRGTQKYGPYEELGLALDLANEKGFGGSVIKLFQNELQEIYKPNRAKHMKEYLGLHSSGNIPADLRESVLGIYRQELEKTSEWL